MKIEGFFVIDVLKLSMIIYKNKLIKIGHLVSWEFFFNQLKKKSGGLHDLCFVFSGQKE